MSEKSRRGFASMDPEKRRAISSKGGRLTHIAGRAHKFNSQEASEAGKIGGRAVSRDREHMAEIGRKGGLRRNSQANEKREPADGRTTAPDDVREELAARRPAKDAHASSPDVTPAAFRDIQSVNPACPPAGARSMLVILENGPFGGCTIQLPSASGVPSKLWIDRRGVVIRALINPDQDDFSWVGRVVVPLPVLDRELKGSSFGYERAADPEEGYDGVLRFADA